MTKLLEQAPDHIKLAVDLILLLEQNNIGSETILAALEIVKQDFIKKHNADKLLQEGLGGNPSSHIPAHTS